MRLILSIFALVSCLASAVFAVPAPTAMSLSTDAPARTGSGNYFVRTDVEESATYDGLITLHITDTFDWQAAWSGNENNISQLGYGVTSDPAGIPDPTYPSVDPNAVASGMGLNDLRWRSSGNTTENGIVNVSGAGPNYTLTIRIDGKGAEGGALVIAAFNTNAAFSKTALTYVRSTDNYAMIDGTEPDQSSLQVTSPAASSSPPSSSYIGREMFDVTATANTSLVPFQYDTTDNTNDTVLLEFYSTNVFTGAWEDDSSTIPLGQSFLSGASANLEIDFSSANIRQAYLGVIGYDAAGNPRREIIQSANSLLDTQFLALGQFRDDRVDQWYGDSDFAGNWQGMSGANISAGANVSLRYFATDYYGSLDSSYNDPAGNVEIVDAGSLVPNVGFDGSSPDLEIGSGNATDFFTSGSNGTITYGGCVVLYRQEFVMLGVEHDDGGSAGDLTPVDSPVIEVKHNLVDDVVFVGGGNLDNRGAWEVSSSANGIASANTVGSPVAGTEFGIQVAAIDQWQNICNTTGFGGSDTVELLANSSDNITASANIDGYVPYNGSALSYSVSYPVAEVWSSVNGQNGLITFSANFYVEESGNVTIDVTTTDGITSDNTANNEMRLTVTKANEQFIYFDDTADYSFAGNLQGDYFTAGGTNTIYAHVTDLYGNHFELFTDPVNMSANGMGNTIQAAYRNDASAYSFQVNAVAGVATFSGVRFDRSTDSGNITRSPYTSFGLVGSFAGSGNYYSESVGVAGNGITNVFFATDDGEPTSSANALTFSSSSNLNSSGNAVAGNTILLFAVVGDQWGNVDITGTNTIWVDLTVAGNSPNGREPSGDNVQTAAGGNALIDRILTATLYDKESNLQLTLSSNGLTSEVSEAFDVEAAALSNVQFVQTSDGVYGSGNSMKNIIAGNTIMVAAAAVDEYFNTIPTEDVSSLIIGESLAGNVTQTSFSGNAPDFIRQSYQFGYATFAVNLFDAEDSIVLQTRFSGYSTNTEYFNVSANTSTMSNIVFVKTTTFDNDDFYASNTNILSGLEDIAANETSGNAIAGNAVTFYAAELDGYGNLSERAGVNIILSSFAPAMGSGNFSLTGANTVSANNVGGLGLVNGQLTAATGFTANPLTFTPYMAETAIRVMVSGNSPSGNTENLSVSFEVEPATPALVNFTTSSGGWPTGGTLDIDDAGAEVPLDDVYIGIFDAFGNRADLDRDTLTLGVNIMAYDNAGVDASGNYTVNTITLVNSSVNLLNQNVIYFDPNVASKQITFSAANTYSLNAIVETSSGFTVTSSANTQYFDITDTTPPQVTLTNPSGGETVFAGETLLIQFDVLDTVVDGTYILYISYDGGNNYETAISSTALPSTSASPGSVTQTVAWTVSSNVNSQEVRLRVQVTDPTGNVDVDDMLTNFTISPYSSVTAYVVGDTGGNTVRVHFREPVYSYNGGDLSVSSFEVGADLTLNATSHTAGTDTATLTFATDLASGNINNITTADVGIATGNVSRNVNGSGNYDGNSELMGVEVHQIVSGNLGTKTLTASSNISALGLKLVGWGSGAGDNVQIKEMRVQIDSVSGSVNTNDLEAFVSADNLYEAISLVDSDGNAVPFVSVPTLAVGSEMTLSVNHIIPKTPVVGSGNYNYHLHLGSSNILGDGDQLTLTLNSILFEEYTASSGANVEKLYIPFGTLVSDTITADTIAPMNPTVVASANINMMAGSSNYLGYDLSIYYPNEVGMNTNIIYEFDEIVGATLGNNVTGNMMSDNGYFITTVDLSSLGNTNIELRVWAIDEAGNNGNAQAYTANLTKDLDVITASNISVTFNGGANSGNVNSGTVTSASVNLALLEPGEEGASYTLTLIDSTGNILLPVLNGSFASGANTVLLTGLDLSGNAEGALSVNLIITDQYGNSTGANLTNVDWNTNIDITAPAIGNLITVSGDNLINLDEAMTSGVNLGLDALDGYATVNFTLSGNSGNLVKLGSNILMAAGNFAEDIMLDAFADGAITLTANATDVDMNRSADVMMTLTLDTIADNTILTNPSANLGRPLLSWTQIADADFYTLYQDNVLLATLQGSTNISYEYSSNLVSGPYTWSVNVTDVAGNESTGSEASFTVLDPIDPVLVTVSANGRPTFVWESVPDAYSYFFTLTASGNDLTGMGNTATLMTNVHPYSTNLTPDSYTWSVNVLDIFGNSSGFSSNTFDVMSPSAPNLVSPMVSGNGRPTFVWDSVADADSYFFRLHGAAQMLMGNTMTLATNTYVYGSNLAVDNYTWSVNVVDIYGNSSTYNSAMFAVSAPAAPVLDAPANNLRVNVSPRLSWNSVADAFSYTVSLSGAPNGIDDGFYPAGGNTELYLSNLSEDDYTWSVNVTDVYGNTSADSASENFRVVVPDISYVSADEGSTTAIVVFNEDVFSSTGGSIDPSDFSAPDLGGALTVIHSAGSDYAKVTFAEAADVANDQLSADASAIKNTEDNYVPVANSDLRQIAFEELVTTASPLNYGVQDEILGKLKLMGWGTGANSLEGFSYTLTATAGVVNGDDLESGANVSLWYGMTELMGDVSGSLGLPQYFDLDAGAVLSSSNTREYSIAVSANTNTTPMDSAKAFTLTVSSVNLIVDGVESVYMLAGDEVTDEVVLTNVSLRSPYVTAASNTFEASDNIFKVPGQVVTFIADYVSDAADVSYSWLQTGGTSQTITIGASPNVMTVTATDPGQYDFALSYTIGSYSFTTPSVNIVVLSVEDAGVLEDLISGDLELETPSDFQATTDLLNQFVGTTLTEAVSANLILAVDSMLEDFSANVANGVFGSNTLSTAQAEGLVSLVDQATKELTGATLVNSKDQLLGVLDNIVVLPTVGVTSMVKGFNVLGTLSSNSTAAIGSANIFSVSANLSLAAISSIEEAAQRTFSVDTAADVKTSVSRIYAGQANSAGIEDSLGSVVSISLSANSLLQLQALGGNAIEGIQATNLPATGTETIGGDASKVIGSPIFELNVISREGMVTVENLSTPITITIRVDDVSAFKNYIPAFFDEATGQWVSDATITDKTRPNAAGSVSFSVNHLTKFAIFTNTRVLGGGGGGGCLLK